MNGETPTERLIRWLDILIAESDSQLPDKLDHERCLKCNGEKVWDWFKGLYCPRCNDWV